MTQLLQDGQEQTSLRNSKTKLEDSVQKLQKQLNELKHGRQKFSLEVTALTEKEAALKQQIKVSDCQPAIYFTCPACCFHVIK